MILSHVFINSLHRCSLIIQTVFSLYNNWVGYKHSAFCKVSDNQKFTNLISISLYKPFPLPVPVQVLNFSVVSRCEVQLYNLGFNREIPPLNKSIHFQCKMNPLWIENQSTLNVQLIQSLSTTNQYRSNSESHYKTQEDLPCRLSYGTREILNVPDIETCSQW